MNEYISTNEAAAILGRTPRRVRQMVDEGKLDGQLKGRDLWISRASVEALARELAQKGSNEGNAN